MKQLTGHPPPYLLICISISLFFLLLLPALLLFATPLFFSLNHHSSSSSSYDFFFQQLLGQHHPSTRRLLLAMEEKARLGSTPPSCYNKCNGCHPCKAVQVPAAPFSLHGKGSISHRSVSTEPEDSLDPFRTEGDGYSNYKPLGWKCCCRNHLFNP
ncbi:hypothetical protein SAY86_014089 [Trapa natans]|uniref:Epidermal patterning factor-like protein n=1 Tax=Trapa natans TaxID=22666 RepID=A0AAN7KTI6_TRANT|nr:hypothetical protein SAY86_014089 [Trapa natans]